MSGLPGPAWPGAARPIPKEPAVLEDAVVRKVLGAALATGGEWAEVYAEDRLSHNIRLEDRRVEELVTGRDRGAGVRVVRGTSSAYAYTNRLDAEPLLEAARVAAAALREPPVAEVQDLRRREPAVRHPVARDPAGVERATLAELVAREAAERAVAMLASRPAPAGEMPVVIASGNGGVLFHESSGHGMEADLVAKEAS